MDTISFTGTVLIVRCTLSLRPPALRPCVRRHCLLLYPPCDPLLSVSIFSQTLFPSHIRRVWVFEGKNAAFLPLMSFTRSLVFVRGSLVYLSVAIFPFNPALFVLPFSLLPADAEEER